MRRVAGILASLALAALAVVLGDRVLGRVADVRFTALAGPPLEHSVLVRPEFRVPVRTNAAGFRGAALPGPKAPGTYRIVVLGDSFTFGYGVRERQAYPARLGAVLRRRLGRPIEVVNLGIPGAGPRDYLYHLAHTGLGLDPDLVVVGLFANDVNDVYQLDRFGARSPLFALSALQGGGLAPRPLWRRAAERAAPNLYALAGRAVARVRTAPETATAHAEVMSADAPARPADAERLVATLGERYGRRDAVLARYAALVPDDRAALDRLLAGEPLGEDMRPVLLLSALVDPDAEADGILLRSPERRRAAESTTAVLGRLARLARDHGARVVFAVLPASEQIDTSRWPVLQDVGFRLDRAMLTDTTLSDDVRALAAVEGAGFVDLTAPFRAHAGATLYFRLDEHWNARGQAFAASRLADALAPRIAGTGA